MKSMRLGLGVALLVSLGVLAPRMLAQPRVVQPKAGPPQVAHYDATPGAGVAVRRSPKGTRVGFGGGAVGAEVGFSVTWAVESAGGF